MSGTSTGIRSLRLGGRLQRILSNPGGQLPDQQAILGRLDHREFGDDKAHPPRRCQRQRAAPDDLRVTFGGMRHRHDDPLGAGNQVHGPTHAGNHLAGDHPVRQVPEFVHLQAAQHGDGKVSAADQPEGNAAIERTGARIGPHQRAAGVCHELGFQPVFRRRRHADQSMLRLEKYLHAWRNVVGDQRRHADAEVDEITRPQFLRDPAGNKDLVKHGERFPP